MSRDRSPQKRDRKEIVTVRTTSKRKFLIELAAKYQGRSVSSFIEWAIEETAKNVKMTQDQTPQAQAKAAPLSEVYKAINTSNEECFAEEPDRFVYMASVLPSLITSDEMTLWRLINDCKFLHTKRKVAGDPFNFDRELLRKNWEQLKTVAEGRADRSTLPIT